MLIKTSLLLPKATADYEPLIERMEDGAKEEVEAEAKRCATLKNELRADIQGLRAIALLSVLFFHAWSSSFPTAFLGVDIFFVISGYLMCMLLSRQEPLRATAIAAFYFRRLKRIVPPYVFVISSVLLAAFWRISPFEMKPIGDDAVPSLFFYSNRPHTHEFEYFDPRSKHRIFLHTWSLSVELQFYVLCPAIVLAMGFLGKTHAFLKHSFLLLLAVLSFVLQSTSHSNTAHMAVEGRIWEFLLCFIAFHVHESQLLEWKWAETGRVMTVGRDLILSVLLLAPLLTELTDEHQLQRLWVVLITALLLSAQREEAGILGADLLVGIGDSSYCSYLVHWPIFVFHRFSSGNSGMYAYGRDADHIVGTYLILLSMAVGYCTEHAFKRLLRLITSWTRLLLLLACLYSIAFFGLYLLHKHHRLLHEENGHDPTIRDQRIRDTRMLWATRDSDVQFSRERTIELNQRIAWKQETCTNRTRWLPSSFGDLHAIDKVCNEKGNGTKNVVVFGNSHAYLAFFGIVEHFRPVAHSITLTSSYSCTPLPFEFQQADLNPKHRRRCLAFIETTLRLLESWNLPIHVLIPIFGFMHIDPPIGSLRDPENDPILCALRSFYARLSKIPREILFVSSPNLRFPSNPLRRLLIRLFDRKPVGLIQTSHRKQNSHLHTLRERLELIDCELCVQVDWRDLWCTDGKRGVCWAVEGGRNIAFFQDHHHVTSFGAMFVGEFLFNAYKDFVEE